MSRKIIFPNYIPLMRFLKLETQFVAIMGHDHKGRGMLLSEYNTRCVQKGEVHELVLLKKEENGNVNFEDAWYLGFVAFKKSGVIAKGMTISIDGKEIGTLIGFDTTHEPNHYNLLVSTSNPVTGLELGLSLEDNCIFSMKEKNGDN